MKRILFKNHPVTTCKQTLGLALFLILCMVVPTLAQEQPTQNSVQLNWNALGQIAVMQDGRLKPLDTVARSNMLMICGKQTVKVNGQSIHAMQWLMDVMCKPELADRYRVFLIHDPDIEALLKLGDKDKRWSFLELEPHLSLISAQANKAQAVSSQQQNRYQRAILELYSHLTTYVRLKNSIAPEKSTNFGKEIADLQAFTQWLTDNPDKVDKEAIKQLNILKQHYDQLVARSSIHFVPPTSPQDPKWLLIGEQLQQVLTGIPMDPAVPLFVLMRESYRNGDWATINKLIADHLARKSQQLPKIRSEATFNRVDLLYKAMPVYVLGLVLTLVAMMTKSRKLLTASVLVVVLAFLMHTAGLGWRMWIEGRPPVINLYGSAVFAGWGATLMALFLERLYKNGLANIAATLIGFATLVIAYHLSLSGDTIEPVRAVLNSNFWLSTHVITVTLGYSAMFVAGALGMLFVIRDVILRNLTPESRANMGRMVYGIICFAMLFSFVGTVLGGIWADQSWGRFWGWDPKENGALLIVLWNAALLHARWSGMVQVRGMMIMAILGNCVTAFSWFGVNMMGVGLHSYGFMEGAALWMLAFMISQLIFVAIGLFPVHPLAAAPPKTRD